MTQETTRVHIPPGTVVLQDSSAYSDGDDQRLTFEAALERQIWHAERFGYTNLIRHRASYDRLIRSTSAEEAREAIQETIAAAEFLAKHKDRRAILTAQGITPQQYTKCVQQIVSLIEPEDIFGLGGFCLVGIKPKRYLPLFWETISLIVPQLGRAGIKRLHVWGNCFIQALGPLQWLCDEWEIEVSTDSAGPVLHPSFGQWGYDNWRNRGYRRPPILTSCREHQYHLCEGCLGLDKIRHVALTHQWLEHIRDSRHYHIAGGTVFTVAFIKRFEHLSQQSPEHLQQMREELESTLEIQHQIDRGQSASFKDYWRSNSKEKTCSDMKRA